jgi:hypothetical protein
MSINSKSTKAEILEAYCALKAQPTTAKDVWAWVTQAASTVYREADLLVKDCYKGGQIVRAWYDQVVAELSRPILKP